MLKASYRTVSVCYAVIIMCSILRETSIDGTGWSPARRLKVECVISELIECFM